MAVDGASGGAAYVRWPDGRAGVLTCPPVPAELMRLTAEILELAKSSGLPVPRHEIVVPLTYECTAVVQERLPGKPIGWADVDTIDALVEMNDRFAGFLADRPDVPRPSLYLRRGPRNDWRHAPLESYDARTRRLLRRIQEIGDEVPDLVSGDDLLHVDYARGNVLTDDRGRITGVIDWNLGVARGDRCLALVSLRSDLEWKVLSPTGIDDAHRAATDRLDRVLEERIDPTTLRAYWAFWTLMKLDGLIWEGAPKAVEVFLDLGFRQLF
jgi:aminoglycoside phosphotransferase (APT) family kinase protein